ncbi:DUF3238 domain-containing protein [bacterium]|nr:DUF3238 domain-containing protein [bacterium]
MSHYVDYKKGRENSIKNPRRQTISTKYGNNAADQTRGYVGDETADVAKYQRQLKESFHDFSDVNDTVANTEGLEHREYTIEVDSFIPYDKIDHPLESSKFHGDGRGPFEPGSSRTKQIITVETDPNKRKDSLVKEDRIQAITIKYDKDGNVLDSKQANTEYTTEVDRDPNKNNGDNVRVSVSGSGKNPLVKYAPAIDYNYQIDITPGTTDQDNPDIRVFGEHDQFPAHTLRIKDDETGKVYEMHQFIPDSQDDALKLFSPFPNKKVKAKTEQ